MLEGVRLSYNLIRIHDEKIELNSIIIPDEKINTIKQSKEFRELLDSMENERTNYLTVVDLHNGKYRLIDGLRRYLIYKDYLFSVAANAVVLVPDINEKEQSDLRYAIKTSNKEDGLSVELKRITIARRFLDKYGKHHSKQDLSDMLGISLPQTHRLIKINDNINSNLLSVCLERRISVRAAEAISTLTKDMQEALYDMLKKNKSLKPTEKVIKTIRDADKASIYTEEDKESAVGRTLGRAKRDRKIIEDAIQYDLQKGIAIKDINNISSKITISNLIAKQEDAVRALENRIYKIQYDANDVDISRIENVIQRLYGVIEYMSPKKM